MDDRGSKSGISRGIAVKEQRVYGYKYLDQPNPFQRRGVPSGDPVAMGKIFKMYSNELRDKLWKKKYLTD